ncbi:MAG: DUF368 domain-containing protein [Oscillospiraceae bacterium]|nr:DUF368 domain-containing protein [Oscillospiraceae bacterium]
MNNGIKHFLHGLVLGITQIVPGMSGGTVAVVLGFYDDLIRTVNRFSAHYRKSFAMVGPLLLGTILGLLLFSSVVDFLLLRYSLPTMLFFIGLIAGVVPPVYRKVKERGRRFTPKEAALVLLPLAVLIVLSHIPKISLAVPPANPQDIGVPYMLFLIFCGMLAAAALVVPGISGAFLLLLLGPYPLVIRTLSSVHLLLTDAASAGLWIGIGKVLVPLGIGIGIGGMLMLRLIEKLLTRHHQSVYLVILGLLLGSVYALFNGETIFQSGVSLPAAAIGAAMLAGGFALSFVLAKNRF